MIMPQLPDHLTTQRLLLAPLIPTDNDELYNLWSNLETTRYLHSPTLTTPTMLTDIIEAIAADTCAQRFSLRTLNDHSLIGTIGINDCTTKGVEIGYELLPTFTRQGYMSETIIVFLKAIWEKTDVDVYAKVDSANYASLKLLESLQAKRVHCTNEYSVDHDKTFELYYYLFKKKSFLTKF